MNTAIFIASFLQAMPIHGNTEIVSTNVHKEFVEPKKTYMPGMFYNPNPINKKGRKKLTAMKSKYHK